MDDNHTDYEGGCACRAVRYRLRSGPLIVHACHCTECQRLTGTAFALNALIETEQLETLEGEPRIVDVVGASGKPQEIFRCPACATALWSHYPGGGAKLAFVRVGTLDEPERLPPDIHIYTSTRLPWLQLPEGALAVPEYYSSKEVWPANSLARRERILGP
ncbi:MAG TPA: GFA family protein [Allosphingosinicella sp.]|nr:GFA family protein [Allosphingosinicella sp.]